MWKGETRPVSMSRVWMGWDGRRAGAARGGVLLGFSKRDGIAGSFDDSAAKERAEGGGWAMDKETEGSITCRRVTVASGQKDWMNTKGKPEGGYEGTGLKVQENGSLRSGTL